MPIYEYQCAKCGKIFEAFQKINDDPLSECKFCNGKAERIISQTSFQLKGSGWYVTDYAKQSTGSAPSRPTSDTAKSETAVKSSEGKSDTTSKSSENSSGSKT